jgi:hypothetical protein
LKTYNNIVRIFQSFAKRHKQVNSFFVGRNFDLENASAITYPVVQIYSTGARMPQNDEGFFGVVSLSFNVKIIDQISNDETNKNDIDSDSLQIAQDLVNEINTNIYFITNQIQIDGDVDFEPLYNYEDSNTNGWEFTINLKYINNSSCDLPLNPIIPLVHIYLDYQDNFDFEYQDNYEFEYQN